MNNYCDISLKNTLIKYDDFNNQIVYETYLSIRDIMGVKHEENVFYIRLENGKCIPLMFEIKDSYFEEVLTGMIIYNFYREDYVGPKIIGEKVNSFDSNYVVKQLKSLSNAELEEYVNKIKLFESSFNKGYQEYIKRLAEEKEKNEEYIKTLRNKFSK